jgi:hypothetical protein
MARLKLGIAKLNSADLIFYCISIQNKMKNNVHFPNPTPSLAEIDAKCESLKVLDINGQSGDRIAIHERNTVADELKKLLRTLSLYVALVADGSAKIILSSGFDIRKDASPTAPLSRPADLIAKRSDYTGMVKLKWAPVKNAINCQVELTTTDPNDLQTEWATIGVTSQSKITIGNLTPGINYYFRIKAFGRRHESPYSDPALIMAA